MKKKYNVLLGMFLCAGILIPLNYFNILGFDAGTETIIYDDCPECPENETETIYQNNTIYEETPLQRNLSISVKDGAGMTWNSIERSINVETINYNTSNTGSQSGHTKPIYASFKAPSVKTILDNVSIYASLLGSSSARIHNSTYENGNYRPYSTDEYYTLNDVIGSETTLDPASYSSENNSLILDPKNTTDNVWFLRLETESPYALDWRHEEDSINNNDSISYGDGDSLPDFNNEDPYDYSFWIDFGLDYSSPSPSNVGMSINDTVVIDDNSNGYLNLKNELDVEGKPLFFNFSTGWPNSSWTVDKIKINFSKIGLKSENINFTVANNQDVYWNLTKSVSSFSPQFNNYTINYTVPDDWDFYALYNGSEKMPDSYYLNSFSLGNGYKNITMNATNGYWILVMIKISVLIFFNSHFIKN